jgi:hypothetical protein
MCHHEAERAEEPEREQLSEERWRPVFYLRLALPRVVAIGLRDLFEIDAKLGHVRLEILVAFPERRQLIGRRIDQCCRGLRLAARAERTLDCLDRSTRKQLSSLGARYDLQHASTDHTNRIPRVS